MSDDHWVVLGLAHPRAGWFSELARWSTAAAIPVDFVKCVSADEVRARLAAGRSYSALLVGGDVTSLDRDLVESARTAGAAVIVVDAIANRNWQELGVAAVLPGTFDRSELLSALGEHASPIARVRSLRSDDPREDEGSWRGRLITVTGPGGTGASVTAMAIAQTFALETSNTAMVLLADFALDAEQGMLHDAREVMPGVQELTEAHRAGRLPVDQVRSLVFDAMGRGYHLLLGLRRHRDWTAIRPRAFAASLDGLLRSYRYVIADIDADLEDESLTGSIDVEDRNVLARTSATRADLVVVVGNPTTKGLHAMSRTIRALVAAGINPARIVPTCTQSPRSPKRRADAVAALAILLGRDEATASIGNPVFLPARRDVEEAIRDGVRLPVALGKPLHAEIVRRLDELSPRGSDGPTAQGLGEPELVTPGSLGSWTEEAG
ncbi:MAG: hypothetical protein ACI9C1_002579 [Candidatus Aldehydirespiratoraceae bacterium]|jgi:hypothetical protein